MIGRLNHVAIAVPDLAAATALYRDTLGATVSPPQAEPDHGVTVVFISHRMREVRAFCDHLTVLRNGRHIASGAVASNFTSMSS